MSTPEEIERYLEMAESLKKKAELPLKAEPVEESRCQSCGMLIPPYWVLRGECPYCGEEL